MTTKAPTPPHFETFHPVNPFYINFIFFSLKSFDLVCPPLENSSDFVLSLLFLLHASHPSVFKSPPLFNTVSCAVLPEPATSLSAQKHACQLKVKTLSPLPVP